MTHEQARQAVLLYLSLAHNRSLMGYEVHAAMDALNVLCEAARPEHPDRQAALEALNAMRGLWFTAGKLRALEAKP